MLPIRLVYSDGYDLNLGAHVFPSRKYRFIRNKLLDEGIAQPEDIEEPEPASDEDVLLVHEQRWVDCLRHGTLSFHDILKLEIPYSRKTVEAFWLMAGGSIRASRNALRDGVGFSIGGGFHHAFPGHGEGFCAINDIAIAIRRLQRDGLIRKALVIDTDVHQGNGTAAIFAIDESVFTISLHQLNNYPTEKPPSNIDVNLRDGVGDEQYLEALQEAYVPAVLQFRPDLILYVAGADPFMEDQLGGLLLTKEGLMRRDRVVFETARKLGIPVATVLAGGYSFQVRDTVDIHANAAKVAAEVARMYPPR
jgi:acetoin utilization deacetylase AcuC-like enzyme